MPCRWSLENVHSIQKVTANAGFMTIVVVHACLLCIVVVTAMEITLNRLSRALHVVVVSSANINFIDF